MWRNGLRVKFILTNLPGYRKFPLLVFEGGECEGLCAERGGFFLDDTKMNLTEKMTKHKDISFLISPPFLSRRVYPDLSGGVLRIVCGKGWFIC